MWAQTAVVGEIGYLIAIPAVLLGFGGAYLDKHLGTSPIFLAFGFSIAFLTSAIAVSKVVKRVLSEPEQKPPQP